MFNPFRVGRTTKYGYLCSTPSGLAEPRSGSILIAIYEMYGEMCNGPAKKEPRRGSIFNRFQRGLTGILIFNTFGLLNLP
jgi:hypothetical protein